MEQTFYKAEVVEVTKEGTTNVSGKESVVQTLKLKLLEGPQEGRTLEIDHGKLTNIVASQKVKKGDVLVLSESNINGQRVTNIYDTYRMDNVLMILLLFFALVVIIAGKKGLGSLFGMAISLVVIFTFIVPQIINGRDPIIVSILGSIVIMFATLYSTNGFSKKTTLSLASISLSLVITGLLSAFFVSLTNLTGLGSEETYSLLQLENTFINTKGLLLGGIIIATLGVLDDAVATQVSSMFQLIKANPKLKFFEILERGFDIGKDHIAAIVNTLVLAYAGASLSLFLLFILNPQDLPYWVIINSETVSEEIVRTLAGTIGIVLAVPIATLLTAWYLTRLSRNR